MTTQEGGTPRYDMRPMNFDRTTVGTHIATINALEKLRDPEFPFVLKDTPSDRANDTPRFVFFIAPTGEGKFTALSPSHGPLLIDPNGVEFNNVRAPKKIHLKEAVAKLMAEEGVNLDHRLYGRPDEHKPFMTLTIRENGATLRLRFEITGEATPEEITSSIDESMKMAQVLHDAKYNPPERRLTASEQILDHVRSLSGRR